jgi:hypothetical protein
MHLHGHGGRWVMLSHLQVSGRTTVGVVRGNLEVEARASSFASPLVGSDGVYSTSRCSCLAESATGVAITD